MALPASLQVHPHFQPEEAAHAATELISNLDNLPGEVVFLLEEIKEKDIRINQLVQRINTRHIGLTKTAKSLSSLPPSNATFALPLPPGSTLPTSHLTPKDAQALTKIQAEWIKVEVLQDEKIKLAERMERIINRAKERAKSEWIRVGGMEIVDNSLEEKPGLIGIGGFPLPLGLGHFNELGHGEVILPSTGLGSGSDGRPPKKRKPNTLPLPSPSLSIASSIAMPPPPAPTRPSISSRSHHSHRGSGRHPSIASTDPDADGEDVDAEGEVDIVDGPETGDGEADDTIYCICQQRSYGEMIGCDNEGCELEWFHVKCVNIIPPLPDTWYCPDCVKKLGLSSSDGKIAGQSRKGRKK
ncbi:uncharacterized protein IL334_004900 [Kwoniella shivajii]|uniref:Chromatin modification-related protein n=1 Tax=Kwoniella shivajii TaxID=564305 RepID=A0ABZ1D4M8_9TREE|nr:hypothetical protein IL334_004900 [Kwoniella shivajii]